MKKEKQTIPCCKECAYPLVWTFLYAGAEYYCLMCGNSTGAMGGADYLESTPERIAQRLVIKKVFNALRPSLVGSGGYQRQGCKKCRNGDENSRYHNWHLSPREIEKNKIASEILTRLLTPKQNHA